MARPNVVFVIADQHRWDYLGIEDNGTTHTPNLDRLADDDNSQGLLSHMKTQLLERLNENTQTQPFKDRGQYRPLGLYGLQTRR